MQDLIELDRDDEQSGRMQEIHEHLLDAYLQSTPAEGSVRKRVPNELVMEDPAQEASESSQELCDTVQEVSDSIQEHAAHDKSHSV
jgi:calcium permeable stress-gated cation channel